MSDIDFSDWSYEDINDAITAQGQRIKELEKDKKMLAESLDAAADALDWFHKRDFAVTYRAIAEKALAELKE